MAKKVKINNVEYEAKQVNVPLADGSGTAVFVDTDGANAGAEHILEGHSGFVNGELVEGNIPVKGAGGGEISTKDGVVSIPKGHYDGTGSVKISEDEKAKIIANNIRKGVNILGVNGSMDSQEGVKEQAKTVTPTKAAQTVAPDSEYTHLSTVTVEPIPDEYITTNDADIVAEDIKKGKIGYSKGKKVIGTHTDPTFTLANGILTIA